MKTLVLASIVALTAHGALANDTTRSNPLEDGQTWADLRGDFIDEGIELRDGAALFTSMRPIGPMTRRQCPL